MLTSCLDKQSKIIEEFQSLKEPEQKYWKIIEFGKTLAPYPKECRMEENLIPGCQSKLYLHAYLQNDIIYFLADSEALISRGLAALMISVYSQEPIQAILTCRPNFLEAIDLFSSLSMNRANGLKSLYITMQKKALQLLKQ